MTQTSHQYIVIMAGGIGSRFWPASTEDKPKQFLDILGIGRTLLQMTWDRAKQLVPASNIFIVTHQKYESMVLKQLPEATRHQVLKEPVMRNTAPCVAYAALRLVALDPESTFAVLPSDHVILKEESYLKILRHALDYAASNNALVTLGIQPTRPDTGYGYIQYMKATDALITSDQTIEVCKVSAFKEKPDLETAKKYLQSGQFLWNAGMFVWKTSHILAAFQKLSPGILDTLATSPNPFNTEQEENWLQKVYAQTEKISIDYAIMERADNVYTIPAEIGWSDLGTWQSLHAYLADAKDTVTVGKNIHLADCSDVLVVSDNLKPVVIKGLHDFIVVDDPNALLIYPKSDEQEIREVVAMISAQQL
jgi:mannose-1-phosphate guanylyltransferase